MRFTARRSDLAVVPPRLHGISAGPTGIKINLSLILLPGERRGVVALRGAVRKTIWVIYCAACESPAT